MVWALREFSGLPHNKVVGMAGVLDCARFRHFLADEFERLGRGCDRLRARRPRRHDGAGGRLFDRRGHPGPRPDQDGLVDAGEDRRDRRSARAAAAARSSRCSRPARPITPPRPARSRWPRAYLKDKKRLLPCAAHLTGQYGVDGLYVGVPIVIGAGGVEEIIEIALERRRRRRTSTCRSMR